MRLLVRIVFYVLPLFMQITAHSLLSMVASI
jgi:hypothetical protein